MAAARLVVLARRRRLMATLRNEARLWAPRGLRTRQWSSCQWVSRTQWRRFSMPQCPRQSVSNWAGPARSGDRLVIAYWTSSVVSPPEEVVRSKRQTWAKPGQLSCGTICVLASRERFTSRPCSLVEVVASESCDWRLRCVAGGKARQEIAGNRVLQLCLVVFHHEQVISTRIDNFPANLALSEHRIAGDNASFQSQGLQDRQGRFGLIGVVRNLQLAQDAATLLVEQREKADAATMFGESTTERLAVDGEGRQLVGRGGDVLGNPPAERLFQDVRIELHQEIPKRACRGWPAVVAQQIPDFGQLSVNPLSDRFVTPCAAQHGTDNRGQHGRMRVAPSMSPTRIGNLLQTCQQAPRGSSIQG